MNIKIEMTEAEIFLKNHELSRNPYNEYRLREEFVQKFGFCIITDEILSTLSKYGPLLEVGCGSGYLAYELKKRSVNVRATDPGTGKYFDPSIDLWSTPWTEIERITGVDAVKKYSDRNLLTSWPDYDREWPTETLKEFKGQFVCYIGEGYGGCTGSDEFHELLGKGFKKVENVFPPTFNGIHDYLTVFKRKGKL